MKKYCQNPLCKNESFKEVAVSIKKPADQTRSLCAVCEKAYTWGLQHVRMASQQRKVWILAVADKGIIVHARGFNNKPEAEKALVEYLRCHENYAGPDDISQALDWLAEHDERLSVDLCSTIVDI